MDLVAVKLGVDRVTAASEIDEVQELKVLVERFFRQVEALQKVGCRDHG
jgi:hypothetical protein